MLGKRIGTTETVAGTSPGTSRGRVKHKAPVKSICYFSSLIFRFRNSIR